MTRPKLTVQPGSALRAILAGGFLLMLAANLPGHLSYDSVAQLYEGRFHVRDTFGPAIYSWLLGTFDSILPGTSLYVTASGLLLFASLASLAWVRGRVSWWAPPAALFIVLTPQLLIYQGIVWKDVAFANAAVAGMICLANAAARWSDRRLRWPFLLAALVLLAAAALLRQNGLIVALLASIALGWIAARGSWRRGAAWGVAGLAAVLAAMQVLAFVAVPTRAPDTAFNKGVRIIQNYDMVGAVALGGYRLDILRETHPQAVAVIEKGAPTFYSGQRIDLLDRDRRIGEALWTLPDEPVKAQWLDLVTRHPGLYLRIRTEDYRWVLGTPVVDKCLPSFVGVDAPMAKLGPLQIQPRRTEADQQMANYLSWFLDTPVFSHVAYVALALVLAGVLLLRRRDPADIAVAALLLSAVGFAASFFFISLACDYRYLYFADLAALAGLLYVAIDPPFGRKRSARRQA